MLDRALSVLLLTAGLLAGIGFPSVADDAVKEVPPKPTTLIGEVVTSGEFVDAAQAIEIAAKEGWTELAEFYDLNALVEISFAGIKAKEDYYKQY